MIIPATIQEMENKFYNDYSLVIVDEKFFLQRDNLSIGLSLKIAQKLLSNCQINQNKINKNLILIKHTNNTFEPFWEEDKIYKKLTKKSNLEIGEEIVISFKKKIFSGIYLGAGFVGGVKKHFFFKDNKYYTFPNFSVLNYKGFNPKFSNHIQNIKTINFNLLISPERRNNFIYFTKKSNIIEEKPYILSFLKDFEKGSFFLNFLEKVPGFNEYYTFIHYYFIENNLFYIYDNITKEAYIKKLTFHEVSNLEHNSYNSANPKIFDSILTDFLLNNEKFIDI